MVVAVIVVSLVVGVFVARYLVRRRRRRLAETTYIPTYPTIELEQPYGGWDADASDGYPERDVPALPLITRVGPPSTWGRVP